MPAVHRDPTPRPTPLQFGLATSDGDFDGAFRLLHDQYVARGYMRAHPCGRRTTLHHALPETRVLVARDGTRVVATVSLVPDSVLGLPCDALYAGELAPMRAAGRRLAEVSSLAVADGLKARGVEIVRSLMQLVAVYTNRIARADDLCITVHLRHARFYEALLRFQRFGPLKRDDAVTGATVAALRLDLAAELAWSPDAAFVRFGKQLFTAAEIARVLAVLYRQEARVQLFQSSLQRRPVTSPIAAEV